MFHSFDEPTIYIDTEVRESSILELAKVSTWAPLSASAAHLTVCGVASLLRELNPIVHSLRALLTRYAIVVRARAKQPFCHQFVVSQAKRDERFYMKPEQIYEILEPSRCKRFIMGTELA